ncbi:ciliogenesis and planar polarity effector 1 isoform X2 [Rhinatrema bivittatum]|uniref:ciliogenesis and planar polarity effector 1 isoform X2 n=1 Tax=Rhinatrema bivittatum TaxID=194408 RepID=UPI00112C3898|nr:ciliogenesis and planar polarity effector 1 isoform X2 [Rhinatrema bivittatum]
MEIKLEVLVSSSIKRKKPCPRFCWLGQEKESIFLLDEKWLSELSLPSGRIKKKAPRLQPLLRNALGLATSRNGAWLAGILETGEIFLWNRDQDYLKTIPATEESSKAIAALQACPGRLHLYVSGDGRRVLVATLTGSVFLWESTDGKNMPPFRKPLSLGRWSQIMPEQSMILPTSEDKEATVHAVFVENEVMGDCCLCSFVFYSGEHLLLIFLKLKWLENTYSHLSALPYQVHWVRQEYSLASLIPQCESVKSRGALISAFAGDGLVLAVTINQRDPKATQILFISTINFVTISGSLKGCSNKNQMIPSKYIRSYWVEDMSWTLDSLFLACMLKRGALILITRLGELQSLVTFGCSVEFGPAEFIPLHPLITYRPPQSVFKSSDSNNCLGSSASEMDALRQRFSVTAHPRLPYLIVSDGYMVTALRFLDNFSPVLYMKSLLLDSDQRLEKVSQILPVSKPKGRRMKLQSLSFLKASLLKDHRNQSATHSPLPRFLKGEEEIGKQNEIKSLQDYEEESDDEQELSKNVHPSFSLKPDCSYGGAEQGRLEFASMFDTIHAIQDVEGKEDDLTELNCIQKNLLMAWAIGILLGNIEEKRALLNYTIGYFMHLIYILQFTRHHLRKQDRLLKTSYSSPWVQRIFQLFQQCLWVLHWDVTHRQAIGYMIKLTSGTVKMMLAQQEEQLYSRTLTESFCLLTMVSHCLNIIYNLPFEIIPGSDVNCTACLDSLVVPVLQALDSNNVQRSSVNSLFKLPPRTVNLSQKPENRLTVLWKLLYKQTLWYRSELFNFKYKNDKPFIELKIAHEESLVVPLLCHIQSKLQSARESLDPTLNLMPVTGEEHFLLGSYTMAMQTWNTALQEDAAKGGRRAGFLQTRYYLALLYGHLYHYNLNNGQGLCDHLVRKTLKLSPVSVDTQQEDFPDSEYAEYEWRILRDVHSEAALAVVQAMGRFMAAYFTNQLLYIFPPHNIDILPPLYIAPDELPRVVPLQHSMVARIIRDQNLSCAWTVEYALDLLLIGGLFPEAVLLAHKLGDWKMSVSMGIAFNLYCQNNDGLSSLKTELHLPLKLTPVQTFQEKLQSLLGRPDNTETFHEEDPKYKQFSDPIEEEDVDVLFSSVQEMLKAAVMAKADILSETFQLLIDSAKDLSRKLCGLVPERVYLPSPPLYCPQPASVSECEQDDVHLRTEKVYRQKVSGVLQRILLLLRASRCSFPAAQWYIKQLKWARKVMQKIRAKGSCPPLNRLPESLLKYAEGNAVFFRPGPGGDHQLDEVSCRVIGSFRELCALCWMHHVRERLSDSCRRFQIARDNIENRKDCKGALDYDASMVEHCLNALEWACRMLPFCRFMNIEELVQDIILSLVGELPPVRKIAEILVKAFPSPEDVRVPLRDKYHSLQQRLRQCIIQGLKREEMSVVMHHIQKVRLKSLKRVVRNIGAVEMNIWEPAEEEVPDDETLCYDRFSLGTSLSKSTLTDYGKPQVYSDAETADTLSEALLAEETDQKYLQKNTEQVTEEICENQNITTPKNNNDYIKVQHTGKEPSEPKQKEHTMPVVGIWEFERDDDEYVSFLELFLSYVLERDLINSNDLGIPLLTSFTEHLQEYELNSLFFDVHSTLKRRQIRTRSQNIFRAGCCYSITLEPYGTEKPVSSYYEKRKGLISLSPSVLVLQGSEYSVHKCFYGSNTKHTGTKGLFGLKQQLLNHPQDKSPQISPTPLMYSSSGQGCAAPQTSTIGSRYSYRLINLKDIVPNEELSVELKTKFGSIARLLEWMIRWSSKRLLSGSNKAEQLPEHNTMIRVKTSAAAILTSLWLLEQRHCIGEKNINFRVPNPEYIVAPVFQPEIRPKLQRERSVDTGYPGSAETPVEVPEGDVEEELCERMSEISSGLNTHDSRVAEPEPFFLSNDEEITDCDNYPVEEREDTTPDAVELPSAYEEDLEELLGPPTGPSISVSIRPVQQLKDENIANLLVECLQDASVNERAKEKSVVQEDVSVSASSEPGSPLSFCIDMAAATCGNVDAALTKLNGNRPSVAQQSNSNLVNISSKVPILVKEEIQERETTQPLNTSEVVRQMLQDEMFRLVQLQQINFMSLMQFVGSSFANIPNMQQILQQPQSSHHEQSQAENPLKSTDSAQSLPVYPKEALPCDFSLKPQLLLSVSKTDTKRINHETNSDRQEANALPEKSNKENTQAPPDLSCHLHPPELQTSDHLVSQGLFSINSSKCFNLLMPVTGLQKPTLLPTTKNTAAANGFPLLKLQPGHQFKPLNINPVNVTHAFARLPPHSREMRGPPNSEHKVPLSCALANKTYLPTHLNLNQYDPEAIQQAEEQKKRWADIVNKGPPKHLNLDQYDYQPALGSQQQNATTVSADKHLGTQSIPAREPYQNPTGIPLLRLQLNRLPLIPPSTRSHVAAPILPVRPVMGTAFQIPLQQTKLALLKANLTLENKVLSPSLPFQPPKLIPLQNLIAYQQSCQSKHQPWLGQNLPGQIQLLKANIEPFEMRKEKDNTKRQRRRAEKQQIKEKILGKMEKSSEVFRPEDSSIVNKKVVQTKHHQESPISEPADEFVIPLGSFDSVLLEQNSVGGAIPTSAELHYLASTRKKATEKQDASTNTDSAFKSYRDVSIGCEEFISKLDKNHQIPSPVPVPSNAPQTLPPDLYLNLRFLTEETEKTLPSLASDATPPLVGHKYINVIDIDAEDILKELPVTPEVEVIAEQHDSFGVPSSAQLHHKAASVTNTVPPDEFKSTESLLQQPLFQKKELDMKLDTIQDKNPWNMLFGDLDSARAIEQSTKNLSAKIVSKERITSKLQEMDAQLSALQNMAENMELDFANTELLVNTIENLGTTIDPESDAVPVSSRDIGVPEKALFSSNVGLESLMKEKEEQPSVSNHILTADLKTSSDFSRKGRTNESFSDDHLNVTGLSDIADIISDLVRDGGIVATELGLTEAEAKKIFRINAQDPLYGHTPRRTENEKKEIQAWMKRKQKERLAAHRRKLDELREQEHHPFQPGQQYHPTSKEIKQSQKMKEEKNKALLSEHFSHRVSEAFSLMKDMLSDKVQLSATEVKPSSSTPDRIPNLFQRQHFTSAKSPYFRSRSESSRSLSASRIEKRSAFRNGFGQTRSLAIPTRSSAQPRVTSLPRDRMSQITRRGMLTDQKKRKLYLQANSMQKPNLGIRRPASASKASEYERSCRSKLKRPMNHATFSQTEETDPDYESDRDTLSPWNVPEEINQILNCNPSGSLFQDDDRFSQSFNNDNTSESTGSLLSKLDWKAIEEMVANVEGN